MPRLCDIQYGELYIDKNLGSVPLGVTEDDIDAAIDDYEALRRYSGRQSKDHRHER